MIGAIPYRTSTIQPVDKCCPEIWTARLTLEGMTDKSPQEIMGAGGTEVEAMCNALRIASDMLKQSLKRGTGAWLPRQGASTT